MTFHYPLATSTWDKAEIDAMHEVIETGRFTMGEKVKEFEIAVSRKDFQNLLDNMKDDAKRQNAKNFAGSWA